MTLRILIIAGSDSGGGAGIQADIKTVTMLGGHAMTAITAITAQNTLGVHAVQAVPTELVLAQIDACLSDIGADAVKIGMIGSAETANAVAERLAGLDAPIVFDPVMVATSGDALADADTIAAFERLMALAALTTPNLPELSALGGEAGLVGPALIKGGHGDGATITDRLVDNGRELARWENCRIETPSTHGTGCTLASAIAVGLAESLTMTASIARARLFVRLALREAPGLGSGHGPMAHDKVRLDCGPGLRPNQFLVHHEDYEASKTFYQRLGLTLIVDSPANGYARFESACGATLSIHPDQSGPCFECDDLEATVATLQECGLAIDEPPEDKRWGWREAWLSDPAGNRVCLFHGGENRRYPPWRVA